MTTLEAPPTTALGQPRRKLTKNDKIFLSIYVLAIFFFVIGIILALANGAWSKNQAQYVQNPDHSVDQEKRGKSFGYSSLVFNSISLAFMIVFFIYTMLAYKRYKAPIPTISLPTTPYVG